ncbi:hypothetical protein ACJIZ3_008331 [Penstemon smallii]|uniref:Uncharacterized protein n=1 Tax=Penstemon smallii TaxID=265156 RepID=A0ABD3TA63_9LAMI
MEGSFAEDEQKLRRINGYYGVLTFDFSADPFIFAPTLANAILADKWSIWIVTLIGNIYTIEGGEAWCLGSYKHCRK